MHSQQSFLESVESHLAKTGVAPTVFGRDVLGDPNFVRELRDGRSPNLATVEKVIAAIEASGEASASETSKGVAA